MLTLTINGKTRTFSQDVTIDISEEKPIVIQEERYRTVYPKYIYDTIFGIKTVHYRVKDVARYVGYPYGTKASLEQILSAPGIIGRFIDITPKNIKPIRVSVKVLEEFDRMNYPIVYYEGNK